MKTCGLLPCDWADAVRLAFLIITAVCFYRVFCAPFWRKDGED